MIKYMRKTIYKGLDHETQDMLLQLISRQHIIQCLCLMFWVVIYIVTLISLISLFIIDVCEDIEFSMTTHVAIIVFMITYAIGWPVLLKVCKVAAINFSILLAEKIYFLVCTTKGKALSKKDLKTMKQVEEDLYVCIATQECRRYCYSVCFEICKVLKKGYVEFVAVKKFSEQKYNKEDDGKEFTMHVLYVNNGWAFDTYSSRQYPIEKLHEIYKAKIYRSFSFDEISEKSYEEFREEEEPELAKWSDINDCSMFWKGKKKKA